MLAAILAFISPYFQSIGAWLLGIITKDVVSYLTTLYENWQRAKEIEAQEAQNLQNLQDATNKGDPDAESKAGGDVLNGGAS